ncbi:MAG: FG-GAP-like repeat-containing protein [Pirellulales bacterium]
MKDGGNGFLVAGASVWNSTSDPGNKFVAIHGTDGVELRDTVGFNAQGAGFYLESATEVGNRLEHNLGVLVYGPEELPEPLGALFGHPATASAVYWVREGNELVNNVATAGTSGTAGFWFTPNRVMTTGYSTVFSDNEAHGNDTGFYYSGGDDLTLDVSEGFLWRNRVGLQATTIPVGAATSDSMFFDNALDHTSPFPGTNQNNVFIEDAQGQPWQGFIDKYLELNTGLFTFGPPGIGNPNYYDGDFGDFDGDGLMDRALIARYGLLWNTGKGFLNPVAGREGIGQVPRQNLTGFTYREAPDNTIGGLGDDGINFADIDNDGDYDVISGGNGETFAVQENYRGRFRIKSLDLGTGQYVSAWQIVNTDLERDGDVDLIVGSGYPVDFSVLVNNGSGTFVDQTAARGLGFAGDPPEGTVSGDVDGDGDYDLLLLKGDNRTTPEMGVIVAKNDGAGYFTRSFAPFARNFPNLPDIRANGDSNQAMSLGDIDDDGDLDLVVALGLFFTDHNLLNQTIGSHPVVSHAIFVNDGLGNFVEESAARWDVGTYSGEILRGDNGELVDVDYDGDLDYIALRRDTGTDIKHLQFYLSDGAGRFVYQPALSVVVPATANDFGNDLDVTDLDGDGVYDIWMGMAGDRVHPLINTFEDPSGRPADVPRNLRVIAANMEGVTLSWQAPAFAATARHYKVYRSTSPGLARTERDLVKSIGERHQDEGFSAPISRWTTTDDLGDADVTLNGALNEIRFIDRSAKPGITYYYSVVHVGTENTPSQPAPEVLAVIPAVAGADSTPPSLSILKPTADEWSQFPEIVLHYADGGSGIDLSSLVASFDRPLGVVEQQTLVPAGSVWRFLDNGSNQGTAWRTAGFNDAAWPSGPAKFGYGNADDATTVSYGPNPSAKYVTTYFRKQFNIENVADFTGDFTVRLKRDDGAIVYVNGVRVGNTNVNAAAAYNTYALSEIPDAEENNFVTFVVDRNLLSNGSNLIAVEVHQFNHAGADLGFDLELRGDRADAMGRPAGANLADLFVFKDDNLFLAPFDTEMALPTGPVTFTASIADNAGNVTTLQRTFNVSVLADQPPTAVIAVMPTADPMKFVLSAAGSGDGQGAVMRFEWYFPDGTTALGKEVTWHAPRSGEHEIELYVWDDRGSVAESEVEINITPSSIAGRHVFYNNSEFDGNSATADSLDDAAVALDKSALLPSGTANFANYTSYHRGLTGVMVDIAGLPGTPALADFEFHVADGDSPADWVAAPVPVDINVRRGAGLDGSDRVTIIWPDNAILNKWLRVLVKPTAETGLAASDVHYWGNAIGETGNVAGDTRVDWADAIEIRRRFRGADGLDNIQLVIDRYDINRDMVVDAIDAALVEQFTTGLTGDLDGNDRVDLLDVARLQTRLGTGSAAPYDGDLDGSGTINRTDVALLAGQFGSTPTATMLANRLPSLALLAASPVAQPAANVIVAVPKPESRATAAATSVRPRLTARRSIAAGLTAVDTTFSSGTTNDLSISPLRARRSTRL